MMGLVLEPTIALHGRFAVSGVRRDLGFSGARLGTRPRIDEGERPEDALPGSHARLAIGCLAAVPIRPNPSRDPLRGPSPCAASASRSAFAACPSS